MMQCKPEISEGLSSLASFKESFIASQIQEYPNWLINHQFFILRRHPCKKGWRIL